MKDTPALADPRSLEGPHGTKAFDTLEDALRTSGAEAVIDQLRERLTEAGEYRLLLDALLLKARHELGLPLILEGGLSELPEPVRSQYEEKYVEAIREVGSRFLAAGEIPSAWPYYRAIGEPEPVAAALATFQARRGEDQERVGQIIEVAFNQGANPRRGFELILEHYGTCSAITALEQLPAGDEPTRIACVEQLVRTLHEQLVENLRGDIARRGQPLPAEGASILELVTGRDWLFADEAYHIDISHLASTVRHSILLTDPEVIALAADLTEYGRRLSPRLLFEGAPPFERTFDDYCVYLRGLLGQDVDAAIAHFKGKISVGEGQEYEASIPAQVLVNLLLRLNQLDEAIELAAEHLSAIPESALMCPGIAQLCQRAGRFERLSDIARKQGNLVHFTAALLQKQGVPPKQDQD